MGDPTKLTNTDGRGGFESLVGSAWAPELTKLASGPLGAPSRNLVGWHHGCLPAVALAVCPELGALVVIGVGLRAADV
mgnify:CR=1 FL=1